jgi:hypothetical protein
VAATVVAGSACGSYLLRSAKDSYGFLRIPKDSYRFLWIPVDYYGFLYVPMDSKIELSGTKCVTQSNLRSL